MAGPAGWFRPGKYGQIQYNSIILNQGNWNCEDSKPYLPTNTFTALGYTQGLTGLETAKWDFGTLWDAGVNPFDDPPGVYPRSLGVSLKLLENTADNVGWVLPYVLVLSCKNGCPVDKEVSFDASGQNQGSFSRPTGSNQVLQNL